MANVITMPRLSDTMTEGTVVKWHKKVGDAVAEGDILAEIETDKAVQEFESEFDGVLLHIGINEGQNAEVDSILAIIGQAGENVSNLLNSNSAPVEEPEIQENTVVETPKTTKTEIPVGINVISMPRLSDTMEQGTVVKWHKKVNETVKEGDILAEIETDKAVQEFESEFDGTLLYIGTEEGKSADVDTILAIIGIAGTDVSGIIANGGITKSPAIAIHTTENKEVKSTENKIVSTDSTRVFASPLAKQIAKDKGIDIAQVSGSGENGRIVKKDIETFTPNKTSTPLESSIKAPKANILLPSGETVEVPNSQMRKIIAKRLAESRFTAPHYYLMIEVNMDEAIASRIAINNMPNTKVSFNDLVIKASAAALKKHPKINSSWTEANTIIHGDINIGVAVAIEDGLVVPVLKQTDNQSLTQISANVKDLATRARDRKLQANEMEGSTFTISNLGMFGIETFTSIINQPNSYILSVGAIVEKPIVKNGQIVVGNTMKLSLACDHRTVDGALGAAFLQTLKLMIENPVTILA